VWCEDIAETTDYREISHTAASNGGATQKLTLTFNSAYFV
jgi:hypothetical protein